MATAVRGRVAAALVAALAGTGCDADGIGPDERVSVAAVRVVPKDSLWTGTLNVGQSVTLAAQVLAADGRVLAVRDLAWASADTGVAVVDTAGRVTARRAGATQVTASTGGRSGGVSVTVIGEAVPGPVSYVRISPGAAVLQVGETRQYLFRAYDEHDREVPGRTVVWSTKSPETVSIDEHGLLRALAHGYGEVTATVDGISSTVGLTVAE